jgi:hypothetical protein
MNEAIDKHKASEKGDEFALCSEAVILIGLCLIIGNVEYGSKDPVFG